MAKKAKEGATRAGNFTPEMEILLLQVLRFSPQFSIVSFIFLRLKKALINWKY